MFKSLYSTSTMHTHTNTHTCMRAHLHCLFHPFLLVRSHGYQQHAPFWLCRTFWWYRNTEHHNWCDHGKAFQSHSCPVIRECLFLFNSYFQPLCHAQVFSSSSHPSSVYIKKMLYTVCCIPINKILFFFFLNSCYYVIKYLNFIVIFSAISTIFW